MQPGDGLPYLICIECEQEIHKAYSFKQQCERNDQMLKNLLLNTENSKADSSSKIVKLTVMMTVIPRQQKKKKTENQLKPNKKSKKSTKPRNKRDKIESGV